MTSSNDFKRMLDCPMCGSSRTSWARKRRKMVCEKCGYEFDRPTFRELESRRAQSTK